jgi:hypothetical protein
MNNFGLVKTKMVNKLTESYNNNNRGEVKEIMGLIKENKDFKELYLLYEDIENKFIESTQVAKFFVDEFSTMLKGKSKQLSKVCKTINESLGETVTESNDIYSHLDTLMENDTLLNIDKKVFAKQSLIKHLTTKKDIVEGLSTFTPNQNLLNAVLTNNFNVLYTNSLNEEQKSELKDILMLSNEEVEIKMNKLKESVSVKITELISESNKDTELTSRLNEVRGEMEKMEISKYNYYKLKQLKNGLN